MQVAAGVEHPQVVFQDLRTAENRRAPSPQIQEELIAKKALTDTVTRPQRKAVVPSKEVIWALEEGAGYDRLGATGPGTQEAPGKNRHEVLDAFILGFARFQVGCSARFNDLQHVHPKDLIHTSNTVELKAGSLQ